MAQLRAWFSLGLRLQEQWDSEIITFQLQSSSCFCWLLGNDDMFFGWSLKLSAQVSDHLYIRTPRGRCWHHERIKAHSLWELVKILYHRTLFDIDGNSWEITVTSAEVRPNGGFLRNYSILTRNTSFWLYSVDMSSSLPTSTSLCGESSAS